MLSEEQKKAIENLNIFANTFYGSFSMNEAKTVLNLITKLQKENEEKDRELKALKEIKNIADSKITDLRKIKDYDKLQSEKWILQTKLQQKDKQIDLMADEIIMTKPINCTKTNEFSTKKVYMSKEEIKQYFAGLVEKE